MSPYGGDKEARTPDPLLAKQVLSQLSYTPTLLRFGYALLRFLFRALKIKQYQFRLFRSLVPDTIIIKTTCLPDSLERR